jgi:hypothetical protein
MSILQQSLLNERDRRVAEIASQKPSIDLEVTFAYDSAIIGPKAVSTLVTLGRAQLKRATFPSPAHGRGRQRQLQSIAFRTPRRSGQNLLAEQFKLSPDHETIDATHCAGGCS